MKRLILSLLVGVGVLLPSTSHAADGDACDTSITGKISLGRVTQAWCVALCDADSANSTCSEFDLNSVGMTDLVVFEMIETGNEDCTTLVATINSSGESGINTSNTNAFDIGGTTALDLTGTRKISVNTTAAPLGRFIYVTTTSASCTTGTWDIVMYGFEVGRR